MRSCVVALACLLGCSTAYYSAWEKLGKEKRDLLVSHVEKARDQQQETAQQFTDALQKLQEAYGKSGTALEKQYETVKDQYERSDKSAKDLDGRIERVEKTANDLFDEWEKELDTYENQEFRRRSEVKLRETRKKFTALDESMRGAQKRITPVLGELRDYTTFLKHNLNAQALGSLQKEKTSIEKDTARLVKDMKAAISQADEFLAHMKTDGGG